MTAESGRARSTLGASRVAVCSSRILRGTDYGGGAVRSPSHFILQRSIGGGASHRSGLGAFFRRNCCKGRVFGPFFTASAVRSKDGPVRSLMRCAAAATASGTVCCGGYSMTNSSRCRSRFSPTARGVFGPPPFGNCRALAEHFVPTTLRF